MSPFESNDRSEISLNPAGFVLDFLLFINSSFDKTSESLEDSVAITSLSERRSAGDRNGSGLAKDKRARRTSLAYSSHLGKNLNQNSVSFQNEAKDLS